MCRLTPSSRGATQTVVRGRGRLQSSAGFSLGSQRTTGKRSNTRIREAQGSKQHRVCEGSPKCHVLLRGPHPYSAIQHNEVQHSTVQYSTNSSPFKDGYCHVVVHGDAEARVPEFRLVRLPAGSLVGRGDGQLPREHAQVLRQAQGGAGEAGVEPLQLRGVRALREAKEGQVSPGPTTALLPHPSPESAPPTTTNMPAGTPRVYHTRGTLRVEPVRGGEGVPEQAVNDASVGNRGYTEGTPH